MRHKLIFCIIVAAALVLLTAMAIGARDWRDRDANGPRYNVAAERMFEGKIADKGYILEGLMYFPLKTKRAVVDVHVGPKEFVLRSSFKLKPGEMVTVIGVPVVINERHVVLARQISSMNGSLVIRDDTGLPLWETNRPIQMDPERQTQLPEVCELFIKLRC